jgi:peptide/nickel transport system ATP-binding protein
VFNTRCPLASEECRHEVPQLREVKKNHHAACIKI